MASQRSRVLIGAAVAVVLAVGVAVTILVLSLGGGSGVELPDEIDGLTARDSEASIPDSAASPEELLETLANAREYSADKFSDAFDGADADVRTYADLEDFEAPQYSVVAIEAEAGPVLPDYPFDDPELTRLAAPQVDRVEEGDAECLVRRNVAPAGADAEDSEPVSVVCQRTSSSLTVRVSAGNDPSVDDTVAFLDAVWDEVG